MILVVLAGCGRDRDGGRPASRASSHQMVIGPSRGTPGMGMPHEGAKEDKLKRSILVTTSEAQPTNESAAGSQPLRRRLLKSRTIISAFVAALVCFVLAVTAAASGTPRELFRNAFLAPSGHVANLVAGATYKASTFPLKIRVTIPEGRWGGAQWKYDSSFQRKKNTVPPFYGWVTFEHRETGPAQGIITMMTPYGRTRSVAAVVTSLRSRGRGATYGATSPVKIGGYPGVQFDGKIVGKEHVFIPFSPKSTAAKWYPDNYAMGQREVFRIIVFAVRGKTVVVYIENGELPADQFPAFLPRADTLMKTLRFVA